MANKSLNTRQRPVFQPSRQKPRNTAALALRARKGGVHGEDTGAQRAAAREALKRLLRQGRD